MDFEEFKSILKEELNRLSINLSEIQAEKFYNYMKLLIEWNNKINLTAITEEKEIITKHFIDSLIISKYINNNERGRAYE